MWIKAVPSHKWRRGPLSFIQYLITVVFLMTNCVGHLLAAPLWLFSWSQWPLKLLCVLIFIHAGRINVLRIQRTSSQSHTDNVQFKFSLTGGWISYSVTSIWRYSWSQELFPDMSNMFYTEIQQNKTQNEATCETHFYFYGPDNVISLCYWYKRQYETKLIFPYLFLYFLYAFLDVSSVMGSILHLLVDRHHRA